MKTTHIGTVLSARFNRNVLWSLAGMVLPIPLAVLCIQPLLHGLGDAKFGVLVLVWMAVSFVAEIGFGRASARFSADALARGAATEVREVLSLAVRSQVALGSAFALGLTAVALFVPQWLGIGRTPDAETTRTFLLVALSLPIVATASAFRGVLEAQQQFREISIILLFASVLAYAGPVVALALGEGLIGASACIIAGRIAATVALAVLALRGMSSMRDHDTQARSPMLQRFVGQGRRGDREGYAQKAVLLRFAGWSSVSSIVSPALLYIDRAMLAALGGVAALSWYAPGHEVISRALLIPLAFTNVLFPRLSALPLTSDPANAAPLVGRTVRQILLFFAPLVLVLFVAAPVLLGWWLGADYAARSSGIVRILLIGAVINAAASVPFTALQAAGRADIPAKLHAAELVIQVALSAVLVSAFGATGAALAWTVRITIDGVALFIAAQRLSLVDRSLFGWSAEPHAAGLAPAPERAR